MDAQAKRDFQQAARQTAESGHGMNLLAILDRLEAVAAQRHPDKVNPGRAPRKRVRLTRRRKP